ncbi:class I SAM-dependent methyltransferase [Desulforamulus aquiferis]|uniref:class I SAM-dependent methyltransferase n=1 Tax=Desulforamulus aquiferis TaxID=1397668 RepID=UPI0027E42D66|nr:class I SAM-dependent methyltransferase [Desulforamulus aquiferis]
MITTGLRNSEKVEDLALELSNKLKLPYLPREKQSLESIRQRASAESIILVNNNRLSLVTNGMELFFHPGLAKLRIKELQAGKTDQMISAMALSEGKTVLDCTLGIASDAIVASYIAGSLGTVVGIEASIAVAEIVSRGLKNYHGERPELLDAMRRINVVQGDHLEYLRQLPDNCFDIVYFDPMFRKPREQSSSMAPLRPFANSNPLSPDAVNEARRVAKHRVVMKENRFSQEFKRLNFHTIQGGRYSPVAYGIIHKVVADNEIP